MWDLVLRGLFAIFVGVVGVAVILIVMIVGVVVGMKQEREQRKAWMKLCDEQADRDMSRLGQDPFITERQLEDYRSERYEFYLRQNPMNAFYGGRARRRACEGFGNFDKFDAIESKASRVSGFGPSDYSDNDRW